MEKQFDILDYLNNIYMHKMGNEIDVMHAGGHHNIHDRGESKEDKEMLEINKKRINIPNARIKFFSYRQGDIEQHNETQDNTIATSDAKSDGKGYNEVSSETEQERRSGGLFTEQEEIVEI